MDEIKQNIRQIEKRLIQINRGTLITYEQAELEAQLKILKRLGGI